MVNVKKIEGLPRSERLEKSRLQKIAWSWCFGVWEIWRHNNSSNFFFWGEAMKKWPRPKWFLTNRGWSFYQNFGEMKWVTQNIQDDENGWVLQTGWPPNDLSEPRKSKRKTWIPSVMSNVPCWCCDSQAKYCLTCPESTTLDLQLSRNNETQRNNCKGKMWDHRTWVYEFGWEPLCTWTPSPSKIRLLD